MAKTAILTKDGLVRYDSNIKDYIKDLTDDTIYIDPDETSSEIESADSVTSAKLVSYSNTNSGLEATNVQEAIDEVNEKTDDINTYLQRNSSSKNLLKPTIASHTYGGVTITVNSDKSITLNGITTGGGLVTIGQVQLEADTEYIYSVNPSKNMPDGWFSQVTHHDGQSFVNVSTYGEDITFTNAGAALKSFIYFHLGVSGTVYDNITFYPMIRLSSIEDDTYQPYYEDTMSSVNYLNDEVNYLSNKLSTVSTSVNSLKYNALERTDVVDNLSSTATDLPLSAKQGKVLKVAVEKLNKRNILFIKQSTKNASSTGTTFTFSEMNLSSALPTGVPGDIFFVDCLCVVDPESSYWSKIFKGNLVWGYSEDDGWSIYEYSNGEMYYSQSVKYVVREGSGNYPAITLSQYYVGQPAFKITPNTIPDSETSYTFTVVMYNPMHFNTVNGTIYGSLE